MDPGTGIVALAGIIGVCGAPLLAMYIWLHRPAARKNIAERGHESGLDARLERIEVAVQAIAIETERIAEAQRFTTKLLTTSRDDPPRSARIGG